MQRHFGTLPKPHHFRSVLCSLCSVSKKSICWSTSFRIPPSADWIKDCKSPVLSWSTQYPRPTKPWSWWTLVKGSGVSQGASIGPTSAGEAPYAMAKQVRSRQRKVWRIKMRLSIHVWTWVIQASQRMRKLPHKSICNVTETFKKRERSENQKETVTRFPQQRNKSKWKGMTT